MSGSAKRRRWFPEERFSNVQRRARPTALASSLVFRLSRLPTTTPSPFGAGGSAFAVRIAVLFCCGDAPRSEPSYEPSYGGDGSTRCTPRR
jgi:hypothetical protein